MIDFPSSPTVGQVVTSPSGTAWRWNGTTWLLGTGASAGGGRGQIGYAQITANQTGITAETTITGLSVAVAMQAGRTYKITTQTRASSTVDNDRVVVRIKEGATTLALDDLVWHPGASPLMATQVVLTSATTGARTFSTSMQRSGGTGTSTAAAGVDHPAFILVEDITYDAGPSGVPTGLPEYLGASISLTAAGISVNGTIAATIDLGTKPYDRILTASARVMLAMTSGGTYWDLALLLGGQVQKVRTPSPPTSQSTDIMGHWKLVANTAYTCQAAIYAAAAGGTATTTGASEYNILQTMTVPA